MLKNLKNNWQFFVILVLSLAICWPIFMPGYFTHHDDLQVMRIFEMRKCFSDYQIPCRWVPDMGYGFGFPEFNYYSVFPYYIGAILSFGLGYIGAAKALFFIVLFLGGISMYLLAKEIFGKTAGLVAATLFSLAPYRALDSYVRGAISESFAISLIPLVFYFALKLIREGKIGNLILFAITLGAFLTCHNIMTVMFMPVLIVWLIYWSYMKKSKKIIPILLALILGIGLSAFFTLPAYFEKDLVQTESLTRGDLNYLVHFVTAPQLFLDRSWGYGASFPGPNDTISFQIGWPHWWLVVVLPLVLVIFRKKNSQKEIYLSILLLLIFTSTLFMMHLKSAFVWQKITLLQYAQFPWRFLSVTIFCVSLLGGLLIASIKEKLSLWLALLIVVSTVLLNFSFFKPDKIYPLTDQEKLSGKLWEEQQKSSILDYLPKTAVQPREEAQNLPLVLSGKTDIYSFENHSNSWQASLKVNQKSEIAIPVFYFPNWQVKVNGQKYTSQLDHIGRIKVDLDPGEYVISGHFQDTLVRTMSNLITLISSIVILILAVFGRKLKWLKV